MILWSHKIIIVSIGKFLQCKFVRTPERRIENFIFLILLKICSLRNFKCTESTMTSEKSGKGTFELVFEIYNFSFQFHRYKLIGVYKMNKKRDPFQWKIKHKQVNLRGLYEMSLLCTVKFPLPKTKLCSKVCFPYINKICFRTI